MNSNLSTPEIILAFVVIPLVGFAIFMALLMRSIDRSAEEIRRDAIGRVRWRLGALAVVSLILLIQFLMSFFSD